MAVRAGNSAGWSGWRNSAASAPTATPGIIVQDSSGNAITSLTVPEGGEATYQVKLASQPDAYVEICIGLSVRDRNDGSITFKGEPAGTVAVKVPFTPENWNTAQTVTLVAAEDDDSDNGVRDVINDTRDFVEYFSGAVWLEVTEIDNDPIPGPDNLSVTPGDGYMDIAWDAVSGATGYDVKAQAANTSGWITVDSNITTTSHRYTTSATIDKVGVRSRNANGPGPWTELSRAPNENWLNTVQQSSAMAMAMAESQAQGQSQLAAPTGLTVVRDNRPRQENIQLSWDAVTGASGYNVVCTTTKGWKWEECGSTASGSTTTVTADISKHGRSVARRFYMLSVRAVTSNESDASAWATTEDIAPILGQLTNLTHSRSTGSITLSWKPNFWTTGYKIYCDDYVSTETPAYTLCATLTDQVDTAAQHSVTISSWTVGGTNYSIDDTKTYDIKIRSTNKWGFDEFLAPLIGPAPGLTVSNIGGATATLTIARHSGNWYYKANAAPDNTCQGPVSGTTKNLTGLSGNTTYTYSAYSDSGCSTFLATAATFTTSPAVGNLSATSDNTGVAIDANQSAATAFITGANSTGYSLESVTIKIRGVTAQASDDLTVAIHASSSGDPATSATHTLSGSDPTGAGQYTYTCSGTCSLSANTTYFLVLSGTGPNTNRTFTWDTTGVTNETNSPSSFGWSIMNTAKVTDRGTWEDRASWVGIFSVSASGKPTLTASGATSSGATLTIANHTGNWYYKATAGPHTTCQGPVSGASTTLSGLTANTSYTYSAYSDSGCSTSLASATVATLDPAALTVSNIQGVSAKLTVSGHAGSWYYKATTGPHTACQGPVSVTSTTLSGLTGNTTYTYSAYSDSACSTLVATAAAFTTLHSVSNLTAASDGFGTKVYSIQKAATAFTTGTNSTGYSVKSVTIQILSVGALTADDLTVAIHASSGGNPAVSATHTLTGSDPTGPGEYTYTCSGNCSLSASTAYFLVLSGNGTTEARNFTWDTTTSTSQTNSPSTFGWSIADSAKYTDSRNDWQSDSSWIGKFGVNASPKPTLSAGSIGATNAVLTIANHTGNWYYKADTGPHTSCSSAQSVSIRSEATNQPGSTDLATLSGTPASGQQTFNCSGSGCNLSASTTYYVYVVATAIAGANINGTASDNETLAPSTNGWSIANAARYQQGAWGEYPGSLAMKVELEAVAR